MTAMEHLIQWTVPHNFLFCSHAMKYTVMLLIGLLMIIPGINAFPDVGTSGTAADDSVIILEIKTPQENGIFLNDVVPPMSGLPAK